MMFTLFILKNKWSHLFLIHSFQWKNVINSKCNYLCRTIYLIDILKMSFQHLEGNFSNTCQEIRSLLADMYYTPSLTLCKVNVYTYLRVFLQAHPFAILLLRIGISLPFQKLERRRPPVFRLRKRAYRSVDFSDKEKRDSKAQAGSLLVNCFL